MIVNVPPQLWPGDSFEVNTLRGPVIVTVPNLPSLSVSIQLPPHVPKMQPSSRGGHSVPLTVLQPDDLLPLPSRGLQRIYLGIGWLERGDPSSDQNPLDVDCASVAFDREGVRLPDETIWYGNQRNERATLLEHELYFEHEERGASSVVRQAVIECEPSAAP